MPDPSPTLSPNDHLRLVLELIRPGGAELTRRWIAALMIVPAEDREETVRAVEERVEAIYGASLPRPAAPARVAEDEAPEPNAGERDEHTPRMPDVAVSVWDAHAPGRRGRG